MSGGEWRLVSEEEAKRAQLGVRDIRSFMGVSKRKAGDELLDKGSEKKVKTKDEVGAKRQHVGTSQTLQSQSVDSTTPSTTDASSEDAALLSKPNPRLFAGTCIFLNGSTLPQISDHKLKRLLVAHGAQISISMARKTVTHVIVGQPNGPSGCASSTIGAGGGLSASKLQQEIARGGWKGVKVVGVDWYVFPAHLFYSLVIGLKLRGSGLLRVSRLGAGLLSLALVFCRLRVRGRRVLLAFLEAGRHLNVF